MSSILTNSSNGRAQARPFCFWRRTGAPFAFRSPRNGRRSMRNAIAASLLMFAVQLHAGSITSISPTSFQAFSGNQVITVFGDGLGDVLLYDGPTGPLETGIIARDERSVTGHMRPSFTIELGEGLTESTNGALGSRTETSNDPCAHAPS